MFWSASNYPSSPFHSNVPSCRLQRSSARPAISGMTICLNGLATDMDVQLLTKPAHSIIRQAFDPRLRVDHQRPINGDGFGVGTYFCWQLTFLLTEFRMVWFCLWSWTRNTAMYLHLCYSCESNQWVDNRKLLRIIRHGTMIIWLDLLKKSNHPLFCLCFATCLSFCSTFT